jgi:hypothetical protein
VVFIDDILIYSKSDSDHEKHLNWCYRSDEIINYTPSITNASSELTWCHSMDISFLREGY